MRVDLQIWDTAGQEKFRSLTPMYYRECAAALVVYDLGKPETLETAEYWIKELREKENPYCILLVGNKSDTVANLGEATAAGRALADQAKLQYFVASAKSGEGVNDVSFFALVLFLFSRMFLQIFSHLVSKLPIEERGAAGVAKPQTVSVAPAAPKTQSSDCGC